VHDKWENHLKPTYHQGVKNYHEHIHPHVKDTFEHVRRESEPYIAQFDEHVAGTVEDILHEHVVPQVKQVAPEHAHYITPHTREIAYAIIIFPTIIITLVFWYVVCVAIFPRKKESHKRDSHQTKDTSHETHKKEERKDEKKDEKKEEKDTSHETHKPHPKDTKKTNKK